MASPPDSQTCANCAFFIADTCRRPTPFVFAGGAGWPACQATDWCAMWNVWPSAGSGGTVGAQCYNGTAAPSAGAGVNGDFYVKNGMHNESPSVVIYQKQSGSWVVIDTLV